MCMYVCMYNMNIPDFSNFDVCMKSCMCPHVCKRTCRRVRLSVYLYVCMYVRMHVCRHAFVREVHGCKHTNVRSHTQTDACALICIYERTCVQTVLRTDTQMNAC